MRRRSARHGVAAVLALTDAVGLKFPSRYGSLCPAGDSGGPHEDPVVGARGRECLPAGAAIS